jgi:hypothetical protein
MSLALPDRDGSDPPYITRTKGCEDKLILEVRRILVGRPLKEQHRAECSGAFRCASYAAIVRKYSKKKRQLNMGPDDASVSFGWRHKQTSLLNSMRL